LIEQYGGAELVLFALGEAGELIVERGDCHQVEARVADASHSCALHLTELCCIVILI
jgi:hypothetical protein